MTHARPRSFPAALRALLSPKAYPHPAGSVTLVETHISWVLLAGAFAYKIKRPVYLPFLDQSSLERRHFLCLEELRLNRRFAPALYLDVVGIGLQDGEARIGAENAAIEYAVRMHRFDRVQELDQLLADRAVEPPALAQFGRDLAQLQARLPRAQAGDSWGRPETLRIIVMKNFDELLQAAATISTIRKVEPIRAALLQKLESVESSLQQRRDTGYVREGHGDLHTRNIVRIDGRLLPFDCVDFEPAFRWIDVADEAALLLMELEARGWPQHAQAFWAGWLESSGDYGAHRVLDLYKAHRALVRAKVAALSMDPATPPAERLPLLDEHCALLKSADRALAPRPVLLLLIGGVSGSGKTWLAQRLAPALRMIHVRSDCERRRLGGLGSVARSNSDLGQDLYSPAMTEAVYQRLSECAEAILAGNHSALIDATFSSRDKRRRFAALASRVGVRIGMIHCQAELPVLRARLAERQRAGQDLSEADSSVLDWQLQRREPVADNEGIEVIELDTTRPALAAVAEAAVRNRYCG